MPKQWTEPEWETFRDPDSLWARERLGAPPDYHVMRCKETVATYQDCSGKDKGGFRFLQIVDYCCPECFRLARGPPAGNRQVFLLDDYHGTSGMKIPAIGQFVACTPVPGDAAAARNQPRCVDVKPGTLKIYHADEYGWSGDFGLRPHTSVLKQSADMWKLVTDMSMDVPEEDIDLRIFGYEPDTRWPPRPTWPPYEEPVRAGAERVRREAIHQARTNVSYLPHPATDGGVCPGWRQSCSEPLTGPPTPMCTANNCRISFCTICAGRAREDSKTLTCEAHRTQERHILNPDDVSAPDFAVTEKTWISLPVSPMAPDNVPGIQDGSNDR